VHVEDTVQRMQAVPNLLPKPNSDTTLSDNVTLVDSAVIVYHVHINYEEEW